LDVATSFKLLHDSTQVRYLIKKGILPESFDQLADMHDTTLQQIAALPKAAYGVNVSTLTGPDYNRMYHVRIPSAIVGDALNKNLAAALSKPHYSVYDNVLTDEGIDEVTAFCRESHVFHRSFDGYIMGDENGGYGSDALLRIAEEVSTSMADQIGNHKLHRMMARKYASDFSGSDMRAEDAAVTVVLFVTADRANLDPTSGGVQIYDETPPCQGSCETQFNYNSGQTELFARQAASPAIVPYKANRMMILKGRTVYASQPSRFANEFDDLRLVLTFLFGTVN
jgi:hypothetical protein